MPLFNRLSLSYFWYFSILGLISPYMAVFLDGKNFNSVEIGEIIGVVTATKIIGPTLWAMLADRTGQQLSIIRLGSLLACLSFVFLFWLNGYWPITICLAMFSLFWTAILPQLEVMTLNSVRRSAKIYGRIRLWGSLGFIALAIVGGEAIDRFSYEAFSYLGLIILIAIYASTLLLKQPKIHPSHTQATISIMGKIKHKGFIIFFMAGLLLQISFGPYYGFFGLYLLDLSYPGYAVGLMIAIGAIAEIAIFIFAGQLFKSFSLKTLLIFSMVVTAIRWYMVAIFGDNAWLLACSQILHAASFGLYHSASIQYVQLHFTSNQQSRGQAIYIGGVYGVGGAVGVYLAGVLWLDGLGAENAFISAAIAALLATIFAFFLVHPKRSTQA